MSRAKQTVQVYCAARSHPTRRVIVSIFERRAGGSRPVARAETDVKMPALAALAARSSAGAGWTEKSVMTRGVLHLGRHTGEELDAHDRLLPSWQEEQPESQRSRYRLRCKLCGLNVEAREENLYPILDALADAGVSEVSLSALAPRLR